MDHPYKTVLQNLTGEEVHLYLSEPGGIDGVVLRCREDCVELSTRVNPNTVFAFFRYSDIKGVRHNFSRPGSS